MAVAGVTRDSHPARVVTIIERKMKPGGDVREYTCELLSADAALVVVRYVLVRGSAGFQVPAVFPPGSVSDGYFWLNKSYNMYRFRDPDGAPLAHRFDAVTDVRHGEGVIEYRDLALDWWALADGELIEEDREEFDELVASGALSARDAAKAADAARQVFSRYRHIIDGVAAIEARRERSRAAEG